MVTAASVETILQEKAMPYSTKIVIAVLMIVLAPPISRVCVAETRMVGPQKDWKVSAGAGLILAPTFTGAKTYSLIAVPDIRVAYKDQFFANARDGVGYTLINGEGWRVGPVVTYTFSRSEKDGGSVFQVAGSKNSALQGMGDVPGTVSLGGFAEYSLKPYKVTLNLHKGVNGHEGLAAEIRARYGGALTGNGPPLIYSCGPHVKFGDQKYINAYWGITPEQAARTGLNRYHSSGGITAYGGGGFALLSLTKSVAVSAIAGFDRLASNVADSPLIKVRGSANQAMIGLSLGYEF